MTQKRLRKKEIRFDGAWNPTKHVGEIGPNDFHNMANVRYTEGGICSTLGHINVNATALANTHIKNGIHFEKKYPKYETHLLVAAQDGTNYNQKVFDNKSAIGGTSGFEFEASAVFVASTADDTVGVPLFALAPNGALVFCNGEDSCIWYGDEMPVNGFVDEDAQGASYKYDYLEQVSNTLDTDFATLHTYAPTVDANTVLLFHFDGTHGQTTFTDASYGTDKTGSSVNGGAIGTDAGKFSQGLAGDGTGCVQVGPGTHADFDFSTGSWTIDFWHDATLADDILFWQGSDATNYHSIRFDWTSLFNGKYYYEVVSAGATDVSLQSDNFIVIPGATPYQHLAVQHIDGTGGPDPNDYEMFRLGVLVHDVEDTDEVPDFTGTGGKIYIGAGLGGTQTPITGDIDEFRISRVARYGYSDFTPEVLPYGAAAGDTMTTLFLASGLPLKGIHFYQETVNDGAGDFYVYYWNGGSWTLCTSLAREDAAGAAISDGIPWSQSYEKWTFDDTVGSAKIYNKDDKLAFWYRIDVVGVNPATTIYKCALDASMQQIQDIWDGVYHPVTVFAVYDGTDLVYNDYSVNVFEDTVDAQNSATFAKLGGFAFASDYFYIGSIQQLRGVKIGIQGGFENTAPCLMNVEYWNGSAWASLNARDETRPGNISLAKSGSVTWEPPNRTTEFKTSISGISGKIELYRKPELSGAQYTRYNKQLSDYNKLQGHKSKEISPIYPSDLYYYRISFTGIGGETVFTPSETTEGGLSTAGVHIFSIQGIPAPVDCRGYRFGLMHDDCLFLGGNDDSEPNTMIYSAKYDPQVFNGENSGKLYFGDNKPVIGGVSFSNQFGASIVKQALVFKKDQVWKIIGEAPYQTHLLSPDYGCVAPKSIRVGEIEYAQGFKRTVAIWASQQGIVYSDGNSISKMSKDVDKFFRQDRTGYGYLGTNVQTLTGCIDPQYNEYYSIAGTFLEMAYDFGRGKWRQANRGYNKIDGAINAYGTDGMSYLYGYGTAGYLSLLNYGQTFAGSQSNAYIQTGNIALDDNYIAEETVVRTLKLISDQLADTGTSGVVVTHIGDYQNTTILGTISGTAKDYTFSNIRLGPYTFHQFSVALRNSEGIAPVWAPVMMSIGWIYAREDIRRD